MIDASEVPAQSLLGRYVAAGAYADCYVTELPYAVAHAQFVEAFYTTRLFKLERFILSVIAARPSTDAQVAQVAEGAASSFAAWTVEARAPNEILLATGRTRSWLMVAPGSMAPNGTRLYFGSAVVPRRTSSGDRGSMGLLFTALLGFHRAYSRVLLAAARSRLSRSG